MDLIRAQHLLLKIQTFLETGNGNTLSRLEKDLIKSYLIQLYDIVAGEEPAKHTEMVKAPEMPAPKPYPQEIPPVYEAKTVQPEPEKKAFYETEVKETPKVVPEVKAPVNDPVITIQRTEPKPVQVNVAEPVLKVVHQPEISTASKEGSEELSKLFALPFADDSNKFSHVPVANIESALGLNERIFTLNELFGADRGLFDATCAQLNELQTYEQATALLMRGPARQFEWTDPARIKMAEHFLRIVARRYPRN